MTSPLPPNFEVLIGVGGLWLSGTFGGFIVRGDQFGRTLGFPTANILTKTEFPFINGSYYSKSIIDNKFFDSMTFICLKKNNAILIETFIFDFNQNFYG